MASTVCFFGYEMWFRIEFKTAIRWRHVHKETFTPILGDVLSCKKDNRAETLEYNSNAVGVYKQSAEGSESLAGHVPLELSSLIAKFRNALQGNVVEVELCGERKREVSLIVPGMYRAIKDQVKSLCKDSSRSADTH